MLVVLSACNNKGGGSGGGGAAWAFFNPLPVSIGANGLPSFTFPNQPTAPDTGQCPNQQGNRGTSAEGRCFITANYLMGAAPGPLAGKIVAAWTIEAPADAIFNPHNKPEDDCAPNGGGAGLYFQRLGDNWSAAGAYAQFRYFSRARVTLAPGAQSLTVDLSDPALWTDVFEPGDAHPDSFIAAKASPSSYGIVFGRCYAGHGVFVDPPAQAKFTLLSFGVGP